MIGVFDKNETVPNIIKYNGEYTLDHLCITSTITENNTEFYIEMDIAVKDVEENKKIYDLLVKESILKVDDEGGKEYFSICNISKKRNVITVYARQITIQESLNMFLEDVRPTKVPGSAAIDIIYSNATTPSRISVISDITKINTSYYVKKNVYQAIHEGENSFLNRWGGEVKRKGFTLKINKKIGADRGATILANKNLKEIEVTENTDSIITRIYPIGFNGITIEEKYIDSPKIRDYLYTYSRTVKFDDVRVNDENYTEGFATLKEAQAELKKRVNDLYEIEKVDQLKASYRIKNVDLMGTEEYKNYSILEYTELGDTVNVIDKDTNTSIKVRVTERKYDNLNKIRLETSLSNFKSKPISLGSIKEEIDSVKDKVDNIESGNNNGTGNVDMDSVLEAAKEQATAVIQAGLKNSYVVVKQNEILIMDTTDVNTAKNVWRWNNGGLGFSSTGYFGEYGTAITQDGKIVADFITAGVLNADIIKTGFIKSLNEASWINMLNGNFNLGGRIVFDGSSLKIKLDGGRTVEQAINESTTGLNDRIDNVENKIDGILDDVGGAIADGIIDEAEARIIEKKLLELEKENAELLKEYSGYSKSEKLSTATKEELKASWDNYNLKYNSLVETINSIILDGKATAEERESYKAKVKEYNNSFIALKETLSKANKEISEKYTDDKVQVVIDKQTDITADLDNVKLKVQRVETTTSELDGKVAAHEQRIESAEQKITKDAIIGVVTDTIDKKVEDAIFGVNTDIDAVMREVEKAKENSELAKNMAEKSAEELENLASDSVLTASEKQQVNNIWLEIKAEKNGIIKQANVYEIPVTEYENSYNALDTYLNSYNGILNDLTNPSFIDIVEYRNKFNEYYKQRQIILDTVAEKTKEYANTVKEEVEENISNTSQEIKENYESAIKQEADRITNQVEQIYTTKGETTSLESTLKSLIEQTSKDITFNFQEATKYTKEVDDKLIETIEELRTYIRFSSAGIELGEIGSAFTSLLGNEKLAFMQDGQEIAYISNNKMFITDVEIKNKLTFGDDNRGYFDFVPRANGNLSIRWRER